MLGSSSAWDRRSGPSRLLVDKASIWIVGFGGVVTTSFFSLLCGDDFRLLMAVAQAVWTGQVIVCQHVDTIPDVWDGAA